MNIVSFVKTWWLRALVVQETPFHLLSPPRYLAISALVTIFILAKSWEGQVTKIAPEPYLDEIFHIPQSQAYCAEQYQVWDPKLTTPPGLYVFSTFFISGFRSAACTVSNLRLFNVFALLLTAILALDTRTLISAPSFIVRSRKLASITPNAIHTAFNIALFPPLFFFSGLFYTDILSTCLVLRTYKKFLDRKGVYDNSTTGSLPIYLSGMVALTARQTNIFWVAVFLGASEAVRSIKSSSKPTSIPSILPQTLQEKVSYELSKWSNGEIHDVSLQDAGIHDFIICAISIAYAILYRPFSTTILLWPYITLLISFATFVYWNGGVVLGDKSNHIATIHLTQLFYLFPFLTFFSAPLILPSFLIQTIQTLTSPKAFHKYILATLYTGTALIMTLSIIHFNTIIHPFTLADNRHYVFYVFRYTILRHPMIRYLLAPVYLLCGWGVYASLCSPIATPKITTTQPKPEPPISAEPPTLFSTISPDSQPPTNQTSTFLTFLLPTILSLITAPLVEPRYFIIPWIIYRLHIPPPTSSTSTSKLQTLLTSPNWLWLETLWFLIINGVTGYMFLYKGFEWPQEAGLVQRFMW